MEFLLILIDEVFEAGLHSSSMIQSYKFHTHCHCESNRWNRYLFIHPIPHLLCVFHIISQIVCYLLAGVFACNGPTGFCESLHWCWYLWLHSTMQPFWLLLSLSYAAPSLWMLEIFNFCFPIISRGLLVYCLRLVEWMRLIRTWKWFWLQQAHSSIFRRLHLFHDSWKCCSHKLTCNFKCGYFSDASLLV